DVRGVAADGIRERARYAPECGLVQNEVHPLAGAPTPLEVQDIGGLELEACPRLLSHLGADVLQVAAVAGRKVVDAAHRLTEPEQMLHQVAPDEARRAGDEPPGRLGAQLRLDLSDAHQLATSESRRSLAL